GGALLDARKVRAVSVVNGLSRPVEVRIGAQHWVVAPGAQEQGTLKLEDEAPHARASWPGAEQPFEDVVLPTDGERLVYNVRGAAMLEGHLAPTANPAGPGRRTLAGSGAILFPEEVLFVAKADWESTVRAHMEAGRWRLAGQVASAVAEVEPLNTRARELAARGFLLSDAQSPSHLPETLRSRDTVGFAHLLMNRWQQDLDAQALAQDLLGFVGQREQARARYSEHAQQFPDSPLAALYLTRALTPGTPLAQAVPAYEELARRFPDSPEVGRARLEARWLEELEDPRPSRQEAGDPSRERVMETARLADPLVAKHPPETVEALELFVRIYLRAHRRDTATALVRRFGQDPRNRSWDFLVLAGRVANVAGPAHTPYVLRDWIPAAMSRQPERMLLLDLLTGQRLPKDAELAALSSPTDRAVIALTRDVLTQPQRAMERAAKESEAVLSRLEPEVAALLALELTRTGDAQAKRLFNASLPLMLAREPLLKFLQTDTVTPAFSRLPPGLRAAALLARAHRESKEGYPVFTEPLDGLEGLDALQGFATRAADAWLRSAFDACMDTKVPHVVPPGVALQLTGDLVQYIARLENDRGGRRPNCAARVVTPTGRPLPKAPPSSGNANGADP
ncbi:tetratricopeptide repeat protein, partial [Corallococcus llansteffanensis]